MHQNLAQASLKTAHLSSLGYATILENAEKISYLNSFQYSALPDSDWFRLLELHPGQGPLTCTLRSERIADPSLEFEALSYVWGSDAANNTIELFCDEGILTIGSNLACALRYIRHETQPRTLWIDAVCINQKDDIEKAEQVMKMGNIYANAKTVLIWIGEDKSGEAEACFDLICSTNAVLSDLLIRYEDVNRIPWISVSSNTISSDPMRWEMVRRLMNAEWFTRIWVLQEVGLSRSATILYGTSSMDWTQLVELMLFCSARSDVAVHVGDVNSGRIWDVFTDVWRSFDNNHTWRNEMPLTRSLNQQKMTAESFADMLNDGRVYGATDQRDRIYAFLGHPKARINESNKAKKQTLVRADYRKSVEEIYIEVANRLLLTDRHPWTILSCVDHVSHSPSTTGARPSWVPRWDEGWRVYWLGYAAAWYRAGGPSNTLFQATVSQIAPTESHLKITGVVFDKIEWISQDFPEEVKIEFQQQHKPLQKIWTEIENDFYTSQKYCKSIEEYELDYSLAIIAGRASDESPAEDNLTTHKVIYKAYEETIFESNIGISIHKESTGLEVQFDQQSQFDSVPKQKMSLEKEVSNYVYNQRRALFNRRIFITSRGYLGIGHRELQAGDHCVVFPGAYVPFVIRNVNHSNLALKDEKYYQLVGECYIQGIMRGEVLEMLKEDAELFETEIVLV